jgi:UDPglucose 6-dehydrogenase
MKSKINNLTIGFIGMSHLGLCYIAATASKKLNVVGYDKDKKKIKAIRNNKISIKEPLLKETLKKHKKYLRFDFNFNILNECNIVFLSQDIETDNYGKSNLTKVNYYISQIKKYLNKDIELVILSQVKPGFTRKILWPKEKLFYQVETLVFGNAIRRAISPERIIVGSDKPNLKKSANVYKLYKLFTKKIIKMNFESAEIAKISINLMLIANISAANEIGSICEKINAKWSDVYNALVLDKRIGKHAYIKTGLGLSGGNLERDLFNSINICKKNSISDDFFKSMLLSSRTNKKWALNKFQLLSKKLKKQSKIGVLGISYKENTNSVKNSPALEILKKNPFKNIACYDPMADFSKIKYKFKKFNNYIPVIDNCDLLIILNNSSEFKKITLSILLKHMNGNIIIDPFNVLYKLDLKNNGFRYFSKGDSIYD